jgi:hypothetical protein
MLSLKDCRDLLGAKESLSDEEVVRLRDQLYVLANVLLDDWTISSENHERVKMALTEVEQIDFEERAAIRQFDGRLPRILAEQAAAHDILRYRLH